MTRPIMLVAVAALLAAGCGRDDPPTPTTAPSTTSSTPVVETTRPTRPAPTTDTTATATTTASSMAATTLTPTTVASTPGTSSTIPQVRFPSLVELTDLDYPRHAVTVDDLPAALTALMNTAYPDPDLTLSGPGDLDRWLEQWLRWAAVLYANPTTDFAVIDDGVVAGTELADLWHRELNQLTASDQRLLGYPFLPTRLILATFDEQFRSGNLLTVVIEASIPPRYVIDAAGDVTDIRPGVDKTGILELTLHPNQEENQWLLTRTELLGDS